MSRVKHVLAAVLCLAMSGCEAQQVRAPVNVVTKLYSDCLSAKLMGAQIEPTRVGIHEFMEYANDWCVTWAVIWVQPLVGRELTDEEVNRAGKNIDQIRVAVTKRLRKDAMIDK